MKDDNTYMELDLTADGKGEWVYKKAEPWMNVSDKPNNPIKSKLVDMLQNDVDPKYNLTPRACRGILRRMHRRGKLENAPVILLQALTPIAKQPDDPSTKRGKKETAEELAVMPEIYSIIEKCLAEEEPDYTEGIREYLNEYMEDED